MSTKIVNKIIHKLTSKPKPADKQPSDSDKLYEEYDYLEAYSKHTDLRVEEDPKAAIGGMWDVMGPFQFNFLKDNGLQSDDTMLDIGCGTLRGGIHAIRYLNPNNYFGLDISEKAVAFGKELVEQEGLVDKKPHLVVSQNKDLKFTEFSDRTFDYIIAQSVFTHLKPEHISECFEHIGQVMHENSVFYFTYFKGWRYQPFTPKDFKYPFSFFKSLAKKFQFKIKDRSADYPHPKEQVMAELRKK